MEIIITEEGDIRLHPENFAESKLIKDAYEFGTKFEGYLTTFGRNANFGLIWGFKLKEATVKSDE